jgi:hypothetical protein
MLLWWKERRKKKRRTIVDAIEERPWENERIDKTKLRCEQPEEKKNEKTITNWCLCGRLDWLEWFTKLSYQLV